MKFRSLLSALAITATALTASGAQASEYLTATLGWYDLIDQDDQAAQAGLEYRFAPYLYGVRPMGGVSVTSDGGLYGYGGLHWDIEIVPGQWYISPNFAAGVYGNGDGKDLGGAIEFRSGIEFEYQMVNQHRVGVAFNHISNASIYDKNPGVEVLMLTYSLPTR
ncbi:MAG: acyloxyacyl hydrolase [Alphaproteobacteria bacterium]|nr:acyloxyacyl hydrolase [Alphaproteobacteria bacterium]